MATMLRQSTTVTIRLGAFVDKTDGVSAETGLTPAIEVSKNHAAFGARNSATAVAHDAAGWYSVELDGTDTGTLGPMIVKSDDDATHLPVWREFLVVPAVVYDATVAGTDNLQVDAVQLAGQTITAGAGVTFPASVGTSTYAGGAVASVTGNVDGNVTGSVGSVVGHTPQTGDTYALANGVNGFVALKAETALIVADTAELQTDWANGGRLDLILDIIAADVVNLDGAAMRGTDNAGLETTLTAIKGATFDTATDSLEALRNRGDAAWITATGFATPTNITAGTITTVTNLTNLPATAALEATLTSMKGATFVEATDSLKAIRDRGDSAWITATGFSTLDANGVWNALTASHTTAGSMAMRLSDILAAAESGSGSGG